MLRGTILNGKQRAGCRFLVFEQAEKAHGKLRVGSEDGIWYDEKSSSNLCFQIVFKIEVQAEEFETSIKKIPLRYRKRPHSDELNDIAVVLSKIETVKNFCGDLERISTDQYGRLSGTDLSPDFDAFSYVSTVVAVEVTEETRLRLLDREDSVELFRQKPEQCHIISRKVKEYSMNPNNIVFMSRSLHQQYDALDSTEGVSQFYLMYVRHDAVSHLGIVNEKPCPVFTTVVHVVFIDEAAKSTLSHKFKHFTDMNSTTIELTLCFPNPMLFAELSSKRMEDTLLRWASYRGVES